VAGEGGGADGVRGGEQEASERGEGLEGGVRGRRVGSHRQLLGSRCTGGGRSTGTGGTTLARTHRGDVPGLDARGAHRRAQERGLRRGGGMEGREGAELHPPRRAGDDMGHQPQR
jgi:hypothetical protein